jgi:hypothetical protein
MVLAKRVVMMIIERGSKERGSIENKIKIKIKKTTRPSLKLEKEGVDEGR